MLSNTFTTASRAPVGLVFYRIAKCHLFSSFLLHFPSSFGRKLHFFREVDILRIFGSVRTKDAKRVDNSLGVFCCYANLNTERRAANAHVLTKGLLFHQEKRSANCVFSCCKGIIVRLTFLLSSLINSLYIYAYPSCNQTPVRFFLIIKA